MLVVDRVLTIAGVIERLSFAQLAYAGGTYDPDAPVTSVTIADSDDLADQETGSLVLGVGLKDPAHVIESLHGLARADPVALVVRAPFDVTASLTAALHREGIVLLTVSAEIPWLRLSSVVGADLERQKGRSDMTDVPTDGGVDLFDVANSLAALAGGPVTIEDMSSRILAFSSGQDNADEPRKQSILGRHVAPHYNQKLAAAGVFKMLYSSPCPVFVRPDIERARPRAVMRVHAGGESLGAVWAIVDQPLSPAQAQGFIDGASVIALALLRTRLVEDIDAHTRSSLVSRLIEGGSGALEAAQEMGTAGLRCFVLAIARAGDAAGAAGEQATLQAMAKLVSTFLSSVKSQSIVAPVGQTLYVIIPVSADPNALVDPGRPASRPSSQGASSRESDHAQEQEASRFAADLLRRLPDDGQLRIGIGDLVDDVTQLPRSRRQADAAVRVLRLDHGSAESRQVAYWRSVQVDSLLLELVDAMSARHEPVSDPLERLIRAETGRSSELVETLSSYLENFGDVAGAAAERRVHPNTFRYRLRKIADVASIDLDDADTRFALMLQLRLLRLRS